MPYRLLSPYLALGLATVTLAGCSKEQSQQQAAPAPMVAVVTIKGEQLPNIIELPGRIEAVRTAEVRARINGIVQRRLYKEGTDVGEGAPLFQIDPSQYRAQVQQGQAALQRALAARANAASVVARYKPLVADRSVSGQENDAAVSELRQAEAQVAEARAALAQNQLELSYTTIRAPIAGRVGRAEVTEGALVSSGEATLMTRVNQMAPLYAVFTESNSAILDLIEQVRSGQLKIASLNAVEVHLVLDNGSDYGSPGKLDFTDQSVDPQTGTQTIRAVFPNPSRLLTPGQFVRGRLQVGTVGGSVAVPERAIQFQGEQASVIVVGDGDVVAARPVQLGAQVKGRWIIRSGLKTGERVVVDGWQKVRPGQKVRIQGAPKAQPAAPAAGR
ncbi:efflux RND transporter periplasmic adaptor subunit [Novosphingobium barchaimii]|uniref:efflux RND transporter periplasmic adaptor subunit n=1 Tax=Novosphingobium barchaimii TaxID=1420591 RepID=UPI000A92874A|nr:efflux RND transporter periplasmic adaptor subunit [Novosphingobium barchaimii]